MGKRSDFERVPRDFYPTPYKAVVPLLPHLPAKFNYVEPCAGDAALVNHIAVATNAGAWCCYLSDIEPQREYIQEMDAFDLTEKECYKSNYIITNPPWDRKILHPMIEHFSDLRPTWLLFDADWMHTKQAIPYLPRLRKIVSVGRVKWIPDSKTQGKDNCAWYLFDKPSDKDIIFYGR